jgi:hypothetical protein
MNIPDDSSVVLAVDAPDGSARRYLVCRGSELAKADTKLAALDAASFSGDQVIVVLYPTKTYSEGLGAGPAPLSPEDRSLIRRLRSRFSKVECWRIGGAGAEHSGGSASAGWFQFDAGYLRRAKPLFVESMTKPNRQDYTWLATKTFGLNLVVRLFFVVKSVRSGQLPLFRAVVSTSWYQLQDAVFTVFGQTYMKFLGKMTGMMRLFGAQVGDFAFVYFQLCGFEFLNRLLLGPLGENPLVYSAKGLGLVFINILQGMVSGGPLIPAINKARRAGVISHPAMMHLYQVSSLTMQFGLFASFGYQRFYSLLTGSVLVLSWGSYLVFTKFYLDEPMPAVDDKVLLDRLDGLIR